MTVGSVQAQNPEFVKRLVDQYPNFKEQRLTERRFKHMDIMPLIDELSRFEVSTLGESYQGREIKMVSVGSGPTSVLMWSQMHGNEATATMALFDVFAYLSQQNAEIRNLLSQVSLHFIPMLNPDGTEVFQRRSAQGIDMNRDALALQCPESRLLKETRDRLDADFGFNLHDQNIYYTVGHTGQPATISFLAPAYNEDKEVNPKRKKAMQVIVVMNKALQTLIPGQVAKYDDTFETRAFGDNIQKWGSSTILIESGGFPGDPEKQYIRLLNYVALITAIHTIAESTFNEFPEKAYWEIPDNQENLNDVLIKGLTVPQAAGAYQMDIAIRREENDVKGMPPLYYQGLIEDAGDLRTKYGYREIEAEGMSYAPAQVYPQPFADLQEVQTQDVRGLMEAGYTAVRLHKLPAPGSRFALDMVAAESNPVWGLRPDQGASFMIKKEDKVQYAVINGFVHDMSAADNAQAHGGIFK